MRFMYVRRCQGALRWLAHFFANQRGTLKRVVRMHDDQRRPRQLVTDASPWGGGALLWEGSPDAASLDDGRPLAYFAVPWTDDVASWFHVAARMP